MDSLADSVEKTQLEELVDVVAQNYVNLADNGVRTLARLLFSGFRFLSVYSSCCSHKSILIQIIQI
jgi:hypothetical protein